MLSITCIPFGFSRYFGGGSGFSYNADIPEYSGNGFGNDYYEAFDMERYSNQWRKPVEEILKRYKCHDLSSL